MKLALLPTIVYEVLIETIDGSKSKFFYHPNALRSRELCLTFFLEDMLSDIKTEETVMTVYVRDLRNGSRIEIISTITYGQPDECLAALEQEVKLYQRNNIATNIAILNRTRPNLITILWAKKIVTENLKTQDTSILLAQNYWIFIKRRRELYHVA